MENTKIEPAVNEVKSVGAEKEMSVKEMALAGLAVTAALAAGGGLLYVGAHVVGAAIAATVVASFFGAAMTITSPVQVAALGATISLLSKNPVGLLAGPAIAGFGAMAADFSGNTHLLDAVTSHTGFLVGASVLAAVGVAAVAGAVKTWKEKDAVANEAPAPFTATPTPEKVEAFAASKKRPSYSA